MLKILHDTKPLHLRVLEVSSCPDATFSYLGLARKSRGPGMMPVGKAKTLTQQDHPRRSFKMPQVLMDVILRELST